ncbi:Nuclear hormone receptor family member nhr-169 [Caenorhabditis elegans]|uniref:Nuclear hormone receptor family member nhr-169 n=1 Tax=Caenorhabditis elegans TaxID=6239 RepID=NH169_CAEEL|nr:Nuclear hormone receptor family member nhr-169 [Caenorhabditis elegans]O17706.2 RecName: Full=Nuclear hormone receptor family member nhr-169 [Caenorhabditis elegans]CAB05462.2 Nuclear hormone receptor family member nhr-169 [Caenorhabditis elegans]|eukprot:NP_493156.2 Nuclear hormone receptor family member nhr-169 [Caenorhabditis elegans]
MKLSTSLEMPFRESTDPICSVCNFSSLIAPHFGGLVCSACASFFRRTVALNIHYLCKKDNQCKGMRKNCRACRFESCVKIAGMKRSLVKERKNLNNIPLYILNRRNETGNQGVVRAFVSSNQNRLENRLSLSPLTELPINDEMDVSKILKTTPSSLLKYYVEQVSHGKQFYMNTLNIRTKEELFEIVSYQSKVAAETCRTCPGVDLLDNRDILILRKYFQFSNIWIESTWKYWFSNDFSNDTEKFDIKLMEFIGQVKSTLLISLSRLKFNIFEFTAFKAICIWKLVYHETSRAMKIVAQEHYEGVTKALISYYQTYTLLDSMEIAIRVGEITLLVSSVFQMYHDMAKLYLHMGLPF